MKTDYQIVDRKDSSRQLAKFLAENGQVLMPMVELIESAQMSVHQLMATLGRATLEAVLQISAAGVAGENHQGKAGGDIVRHGRQSGTVSLQDRKVRVERPRLRKRDGGAGAEVSVPAYEAMKADDSLGEQVLKVMMRGVSTRNYQEILPDACDAVGVSKSSVSREFVEASEQTYKSLLGRRFEKTDLLVLYIDGIVIGGHSVLAAIGVDAAGYKHVLGIREGASENATVVKALLSDLVERGVAARGEAAVCDRRVQGASGRYRRSVRRGQSGAAVPPAQRAQRSGSPAGRAERLCASDDAGGVHPGSGKGRAAAGDAGKAV